MVKLNKIYTRTGDKGTTMLGDGSRRDKHDLRVESYGTVDEANACIGVAIGHAEQPIQEFLYIIQNDLFDVGADLCRPIASKEHDKALRIHASRVTFLEEAIDKFNASLPALTSFILPSGNALAAHLHLARTIVRRAERLSVALHHHEMEATNPITVQYLNRLSDLLFVMARNANSLDDSERLWVPGGSRDDD